MRTREKIIAQIEQRKVKLERNGKISSWTPVPIEIELLLDIRDLLMNKTNTTQ